jgi:hypothetical protein
VISLLCAEAIARRDKPVCGGNAAVAVLGTAENSAITADVAAVIALAKPSVAQDFREGQDFDG